MTILTKTLLDCIRNNNPDLSDNLTLTEIDDLAAQNLANALQYNSTFRTLDLSSPTNRIGDTGAQALANALDRNYTLIELLFNRQRAENISDDILNRITQQLTYNQHPPHQPEPGYAETSVAALWNGIPGAPPVIYASSSGSSQASDNVVHPSSAANINGGMSQAAAPTPYDGDLKEEVADLRQAVEPQSEALPIKEKPIAEIAREVIEDIITPYKKGLNMDSQSLCAQTYRFFFKHTGLARLQKLEDLCEKMQNPGANNSESRQRLIEHLWPILQSNSKIMKPLVMLFLTQQCEVLAIEGSHRQEEIHKLESALTQANLLPNLAP